jgi:hypothetical protein
MSFSCLSKIEPDRGTSVAVAFDDDGMVEPGFLNTQAKPTRASKKFD